MLELEKGTGDFILVMFHFTLYGGTLTFDFLLPIYMYIHTIVYIHTLLVETEQPPLEEDHCDSVCRCLLAFGQRFAL